jgi:hypothetical protein
MCCYEEGKHMEHTNDPTKIFAQYSEGVTIHDDKTITITPKVQRDILDCTAMLMHEHRKIMVILGLVVGMLDSAIEEDNVGTVVNDVREMLTAYFQNPDAVALYETDTPEGVDSLMSQLKLINTEDQVEN